MKFNYEKAFSRNIGWVTPDEQQRLRQKCVAIAGLGGVGGSHLLTLTRLGIGAFRIADFDAFDIVNFNRQAGANLLTLGRQKAEVMPEMARAINPELELEVFGEGITGENMDAFLRGADLYIDGLDFFAFSARKGVFDACARLGITAITAAPLGMGAAVLTYLPGGMTFSEYFCWDGCSEIEMTLRFLVALSPRMLQRSYLVFPEAVDFLAHKGPSTPMACDLCAGMTATESLKILLKRGKVISLPRGLHFDAYRNKLVTTWRPGGNRNPIQKIMLKLAARQFRHMGIQA